LGFDDLPHGKDCTLGNEWIGLLRIPSISADPTYATSVNDAAKSVADHLTRAGAEYVTIYHTKGYQIVYGEKIIDPTLPTVLVYGHYNVQPADPLELWDSSSV
jgi:acetylornithine deacetylase/succinyl-diaminopimelate desuccinylase-like protein